MTDLTRIEERFRMANPVPDPANPPVTASTAAAVLLDFGERTGTMQTQQTTRKTTTPRRRWNRQLVTAAAFLVVLIAGIAIVLASTSNDQSAPATQPPTTITSDEALAVSGDHIEAFNTGDADAVMALFTPDVTFASNFVGDPVEAIDRESLELSLAWHTAQGTIYTPPECAVTEEGTGAAVTVSCETGTDSATHQAVDAPPVPTVLTIVVTPDGIRQVAFEYSQPDFLTVFKPFDSWVLLNHRDDAGVVAFGNWATIEQAERGGRLVAQYAQEWAAFLEANNCDYQSLACGPPDQ